MKKYRVDLIMSDQMYIDADTEEEAKKMALDKFGSSYYVDEVKATEQYNGSYYSLLAEIKELKYEKENAKLDLLHKTEKRLNNIIYDMKSSGIFDDWNGLKAACKEIGIRLCPYTGWDEEPKCTPLMDEYYHQDDGLFGDSDYYSFKIEGGNGQINWRLGAKTKYVNDQQSILEMQIKVLEDFKRLYNKYREIQLNRIYKKMQKIKMETKELRRENTKE